MPDHPTSKNADGLYEPFPIAGVPWQHFTRGDRFGMRYQHLSAFGGAAQISVANEILEPGRQANPFHYHLLEEEHLFMLEGALTLRLGEKTYVMNAGDYVCFPAGQKAGHSVRNHTDAPCRYLMIGNPHPHEVAVFPDTGRVEVKLMRAGYRQDATQGYWDGVDDGAS